MVILNTSPCLDLKDIIWIVLIPLELGKMMLAKALLVLTTISVASHSGIAVHSTRTDGQYGKEDPCVNGTNG